MSTDPLASSGPGSTPFDWTEEQDEIRSLLRKKFATLNSTEVARTSLESQEEAAKVALDLWRDLCTELGLASLTLPEQYGGMGLGRVELAIVGEEMGRALVGGPYFSTIVLAAEAIVASGDATIASELLPQIAEGTITGALALTELSTEWASAPTTRFADGKVTGVKRGVIGAVGADQVIVLVLDEANRESLVLVDIAAAGDAARIEQTDALDSTRNIAEVTFNEAPARLLGESGAAREVLTRVRETAAIFLAAEQAGGSQMCVEITAEYARTRIQFGQKIGRFQGVKHRLADMEVRTAQAHAAAVWASWAEPRTNDAALGAAVARIWCTESYLQNAFDMIQLHGGIGITWEHDAHLFLRRAQADAAVLGSLTHERSWLASTLGRRDKDS